MQKTELSIVLAEDRDEEYDNFLKAINLIPLSIKTTRFKNGFDALAHLKTADAVDAIFLDVDMPIKNGLLTLQGIRAIKKYDSVPVIILSGSGYPLGIKTAYQLNATFFVLKRPDFEKVSAGLKVIFESSYFANGQQPPEAEFYIE